MFDAGDEDHARVRSKPTSRQWLEGAIVDQIFGDDGRLLHPPDDESSSAVEALPNVKTKGAS